MNFSRYFLLSLVLIFSMNLLAEATPCLCEAEEDFCVDTKLNFVENKGQWDSRIAYDCELGGLNHVFLEKSAFTYVLYDRNASASLHDELQKRRENDEPYLINRHSYRVEFIGAQTESFSPENARSAYNNYFLGNDPTRWKSEVSVYQRVIYNEIYSGVDLAVYAETGDFKYDFIVKPEGNPQHIAVRYDGVDDIKLIDGDLYIETSIGQLVEIAPYSYQFIDGKTRKIPSQYSLKNGVLTFVFPEGYNTDYDLIIDPTVVGATLSGTSTSKVFGHTATFDNEGNAYVGGISFGVGYPATIGAVQTNFAGGEVDIVISKYNQEATDLLYATYLGGDDDEYPMSLVANQERQLYVYGTSRSDDYPISSNAFQPIQAGQSDIVISKLNIDGTALLGSTFVGGDRNDGLNGSTIDDSQGDVYKGEIILDGSSNVYVASCSVSDDFPITPNAYQTVMNSEQDGVVFKLSSDLSNLFWSTYLGSEDEDACYGLRLRDDGSIYVTGFAGESDFPMPSGGVMAWPGGSQSAFIINLSSDGSNLLHGTFYGTDDDDKGSFIDIDEFNQVHIYGVTDGEIPITPGTYFLNEESRQFFVGLSPNLDEVIYSTVFGTGNGAGSSLTPYNFIPVAFMVDRCNYIYFSGYQAVEGLPVSSDAFSNEGGTFYLGVFEPEATGLSFSTYYGGANHVDGGTSRFDKSGTVYQAVCSCVYRNSNGQITEDNSLNTTAGAWSESQLDNIECDAGVFIVDFESPSVTALAYADPGYVGCTPFEVDFFFTGHGADSVYWNFGTGDSITAFNPTYTFTEPGVYTIQQIAENLNRCNVRDTFYLEVQVFGNGSSLQELALCPDVNSTILESSYSVGEIEWSTGETSSTIEVFDDGVYWVEVGIDTCVQRDSFIVSFLPQFEIDLGEDIAVCDEPSITLDAFNPAAEFYMWNTGDDESTLVVSESGEYSVMISNETGCIFRDTIEVLISTTPDVDLGEDIVLCEGVPVDLSTTFAGFPHTWQDGSTNETFVALDEGIYSVTVNNNGCEGTDEIEITHISAPDIVFETVEISCEGESDGAINLVSESGGTSFTYEWSNGELTPDIDDLEAGQYTVSILNEFDCESVLNFNIVDPLPLSYQFNAQNPTCNLAVESSIEINNLQGGTAPYTVQINSDPPTTDTIFSNLAAGFYTVVVSDSNGCSSVDTFTAIELSVIAVDAGEDQEIRLGESTSLTGTATDFTNTIFDWMPGETMSCTTCTDPEVTPFFDTEYIWTVTDTTTNCVYMDTVVVRVNRDKNVYVPNVFSPNDDGVNDMFSVFSDGTVTRIREIRIYDRWGELIFMGENIFPNNPDVGWDGTFKGRPLNPQVLAYMVEVEYIDGESEIISGTVTVIK